MFEHYTRRGFLCMASMGAAAVCGVGGVCGVGARADSRAEPWRMRLSTSSIHFMELPIEQACQQIAALGFTGIDIWSAHEDCPHLDDIAERLGPEGLTTLLETNRLELCSFSTYRGGYARYAELLGRVGGGVAIQGSTGPCESSELTSRMKQFLEGLKPLVALAEQHNSYLAIENHGHALLNSLDSIKAFVALNESKHLGIALAPYHIQANRESVTDAISLCGDQLLFFYAWQNQPGLKQLPGLGPTDFTPWLEALAGIGYRGYVNPFAHTHPGTASVTESLAASREYLQRCYERASK